MDATERAKAVTVGMCGLLMRTYGAATETGYIVLENDGVAILTANIADAIRAAVAEERERCIAVVQDYADERPELRCDTFDLIDPAEAIARIRAVPT